MSLVHPVTRGDPESPLRWISKSLRHLVEALKKLGHKVSTFVIRRILRQKGYSLQANRKTQEGGKHPDRDLQFQYISKRMTRFINEHEPVISIDAKKKELIGNFKNNGREWHPKEKPPEVNVYDFLPKFGVKAVPYGIYDIARNSGFVNLGISADTAVFAGKSILKWWKKEGRMNYPNATKLLITADGGGSNGRRVRLWKIIVQELANKLRLPISVCHYPPGTSKWNKIEHRLFSHISMNWRGEPLTSIQKMKNLIANTKTREGLTVSCRIDDSKYRKGIKISDNRMNRLKMIRHLFHGEWNYTISPQID